MTHKTYNTYNTYNTYKPYKTHKTYKTYKPHKTTPPKKGLPHVIVRQAFSLFLIIYSFQNSISFMP